MIPTLEESIFALNKLAKTLLWIIPQKEEKFSGITLMEILPLISM
jgi:hypothetical protein